MPRVPVPNEAPSIQTRIKAHLSDDLITLLEEMVPVRNPDPSETLEQIRDYAGQRRLVDTLKALHEND